MGLNESLFLAFTLFLLTLSLVAFRMGKMYLFVLVAVFSVVMNIFVTKQFHLFGLAVTGGNALYGSIFLLTDLLSEHYGKKEALRAVLVGFLTTLFFVVATQALLLFEPNEFDFVQPALATVFSLTPRILFGSLLAFAIAQTLDVHLYRLIRVITRGRFLFLRNNGSTLVSQFVDTLIFTFVGITTVSVAGREIGGVIPLDIFWEVALATYVIKMIVAALDTPFLYLSRKFLPAELKKAPGRPFRNQKGIVH